MTQTESISFWTPIMPDLSQPLSAAGWVRWEADRLLGVFSHKVYRLEPDHKLKWEDAPERSLLEIAITIGLIATVILPAIALVIKIVDRFIHQYTLITPSLSPLAKRQVIPDFMEVVLDPADLLKPDEKENVAPPAQVEEKKIVHEEKKAEPDADAEKARARLRAEEEEFLLKEAEAHRVKVEADRKRLEEEKKGVSDSEAEKARARRLKAEEEEFLLKEAEAHRIKVEAESKRLREEEEKKVQAEAERKRIEEEKQMTEKSLKCHQVAVRFFPKMLEMYYGPDGQLNNEYGKHSAFHHFWGAMKKEYPDWLRKEADAAEAAGYVAVATASRKKAEENEKVRLDYIENELQKTFFPVGFERGEKLTYDECFVDCKLEFANQEFFHGTTKERAELIKKEGFNPEWPAGLRTLDSGYGAYLALNKGDAEGYAKKAKDGEGAVLKMKVQATGKFAQYDQKMFMVVNQCFDGMSDLFIQRNEEAIMQELEKEGVRKADDLKWSSRRQVVFPLVNLFTRDFYARKGYRGVYASSSDRAGCAYLNVFYPKEDIIEIA